MESLISVIVPVYNVQNYLRKCIDSIINQTYKNLEIILVDDGSTDLSGAICDEYLKQDSRILVFHKENGGLSDARNYGMRFAKGEYVSFIDSDDWIELDMLQVLSLQCKYNNADIAICGYSKVYKNRIETQKSDLIEVWDKFKAIENHMMHKDKYKIGNAAWNKLYKRKIIQNIPFPKGRYYEDIFFSVLALYNSKLVVYVDKAKYNYVVEREGSIMNKGFSERIVKDEMYLENQRNEFFRKNGLFEIAEFCDKNFCVRAIEYHRETFYSSFSDKEKYLKQIEKYFNITHSRVNSELFNGIDKIKVKLFKFNPALCDFVLSFIYKIIKNNTGGDKNKNSSVCTNQIK